MLGGRDNQDRLATGKVGQLGRGGDRGLSDTPGRKVRFW
jgi:hypothetical protein